MSPTEPKRSTTIKYIDPQVPQTELPAYAGSRYEATVPDTLDLFRRIQSSHQTWDGKDPKRSFSSLYGE